MSSEAYAFMFCPVVQTELVFENIGQSKLSLTFVCFFKAYYFKRNQLLLIVSAQIRKFDNKRMKLRLLLQHIWCSA